MGVSVEGKDVQGWEGEDRKAVPRVGKMAGRAAPRVLVKQRGEVGNRMGEDAFPYSCT